MITGEQPDDTRRNDSTKGYSPQNNIKTRKEDRVHEEAEKQTECNLHLSDRFRFVLDEFSTEYGDSVDWDVDDQRNEEERQLEQRPERIADQGEEGCESRWKGCGVLWVVGLRKWQRGQSIVGKTRSQEQIVISHELLLEGRQSWVGRGEEIDQADVSGLERG